MPSASRDNQTLGKLFEEAADGFGAFARMVEKIEAELQERLASLSFAPGMLEEGGNIWQAQRDANARERPGLSHRE